MLVLIVLFCGAVTAATVAGALAGGATAVWIANQQATDVPTPLRTADGVAERAAVRTDQPDADAATLTAVRATRPAVVTVWNIGYAKTSFFSPAQLRVVGEGSGVVFDKRGYIATNAHVVEGAQRIEVVFLDGSRGTAEVVNQNTDYDVAILHTDATLPAVATLADSSHLEPGMRVLAIGSPLGTQYQNTVTTGIIAGLNRRVTQRGYDWFTGQQFEVDVVSAPLIQTDAAINSGNSGGPLINLHGEVVALNTLIVRQGGGTSVEGLGFAIPSNVVKALADEWIDGVKRGWLGIDFDTIDPVVAEQDNLPRGAGALVTRVYANTTAASAGLETNDIVTGIDGTSLDLDHALADQLWHYRAGDTVTLSIERAGRAFDVSVKLDADPRSGQ
jgi:S1-C subfamily serine protease